MISLKINRVPVLFIKAFDATDVQCIIEFVRDAARFYSGNNLRVLFIDTPITAATVEAVEKLKAENFQVVFRDHHGIFGDATNERERKVKVATTKLENMLGADCRITFRHIHPACSTLVSTGEFSDAVAIIADPDADGLTAAMKAAGVYYEGLDDDAALLDGEPKLQITGTPMSQLLAKGLSALPSYDATLVDEREAATRKLFVDWVAAVCGDAGAMKRLEERVLIYDQSVLISRTMAQAAKEIAPGVVLVDTAHKQLFDKGMLFEIIEGDPNCKIIVLKKSLGPIARLHGLQYSLAVCKAFQEQISLFEMIPSTASAGPEVGIISNVPFLLHVSEDVWKSEVLPRLKERMSS